MYRVIFSPIASCVAGGDICLSVRTAAKGPRSPAVSTRLLFSMSVSSPFLSLIQTLATGLRDHPNPGRSQLDILPLITSAKITSAKTLVPNKVTF